MIAGWRPCWRLRSSPSSRTSTTARLDLTFHIPNTVCFPCRCESHRYRHDNRGFERVLKCRMAPPKAGHVPNSADSSTLVSASLASASSLVLLQLLSRVFTFVLNQALVRLVTPQVFGTASIQFELLLSTILFLSREGVRNALLRSPTAKSNKSKESSLTDNIALLPVLLGIPVAIVSASIYLSASSSTTSSQPHFRLSAVSYALAAFCELLSEPLYIRAQNELRFDVRVKAEGTAVFMKTVVTFFALVLLSPEWALVAFAAGQAAYGLTMLFGFLNAYAFRTTYWPRKVSVEVHGKCVFRDVLHEQC